MNARSLLAKKQWTLNRKAHINTNTVILSWKKAKNKFD